MIPRTLYFLKKCEKNRFTVALRYGIIISSEKEIRGREINKMQEGQRKKRQNTKHCLLRKIIAALCSAVMVIGHLGATADAGEIDATSAQAGFQVDLGVYKPVQWYSRSDFYTYYNGKKVGYTAIDWGVTRAKAKSGGQYTDLIMSRITMQGKGADRVYGYSNRLVVSSSLNSGQTLFQVSPKNNATSKSYTLGLSAGIGSDGANISFSGEKTFTKNALEVSDETNWEANKPRVRYEYYHDFWTWQNTLDSYCYGRNDQLMAFSIRTNKSKYLARINVEAQFKLFDSDPQGWAKALGAYADGYRTVVFYTPY